MEDAAHLRGHDLGDKALLRRVSAGGRGARPSAARTTRLSRKGRTGSPRRSAPARAPACQRPTLYQM
ncbi:hypothetical protein ACIBIZ_41120 [Nonomuraea spiralis]|uniref:hypothetical protein n=1 Tax=Nonomuraea spiralis TaxID=46182 RepID=UPI00379550CA